MENNRQKNAQLDYLRYGLPDDFSFSTEYGSGKSSDDVEGVVFYKADPCALVIYGQNHSSIEQKDNAKRQMRRFGMPYALVFYDDSWQFFMQDNDEIVERGKIDVFINTIGKIVAEECNSFSSEEIQFFLKQLRDICQRYNLSEELRTFIAGLMVEKVVSRIDIEKFELAWSFESELEQDFFTALVGKCQAVDLCRYTTLDSLFRILSEGKMSMCGIACMNDRSECYYVDQYLKNNRPRSISELSQDEISMLNSYFILSCSDKSLEDNLLMWRIYANEATGVCLNYHVNKEKINKPFYLAKVCYAKRDGFHPELEFIRDIMNITIRGRRFRLKNLSLWKHFFKQYEYKDEQEIRLLYFEPDKSKYKWIKTSDQIVCPIVEFNYKDGCTFPLSLSKITLGPKSPENETNKPQIKYLLDCGFVSKSERTVVESSKISSYR